MDKLKVLEMVNSWLTFQIDKTKTRKKPELEETRLEVLKLYRKYKEEENKGENDDENNG